MPGASKSAVVAVCLLLSVAGCASSQATETDAPVEAADPTTTSSITPATSAATTTTTMSSTTTAYAVPELPPELEPRYPVVLTEGLTGPDTQEIAMWQPQGDGPWPIVLLLHGWGARGIHYAPTAELLAGQGVLVFAPNYRSTDIVTANWRNTYRDAECAYRHVRMIASDYQGDTDHPVTLVGHSIGASVGMSLVLDEFSYGPDGPFDGCPGDTPRPEQLVALSGCYYKDLEGQPLPFTPAEWGWTNQSVKLTLAVGADDEVCDAWQTEDAAEQLIADGYQPLDTQIIDDADHFSVIFTGYNNGPWYGPDVEWHALPNDRGGVAAVEIMLHTIEQPTD